MDLCVRMCTRQGFIKIVSLFHPVTQSCYLCIIRLYYCKQEALGADLVIPLWGAPPPNSPTPVSMLPDHCSYMLNEYKTSKAQWNIMKRRSGSWGTTFPGEEKGKKGSAVSWKQGAGHVCLIMGTGRSDNANAKLMSPPPTTPRERNLNWTEFVMQTVTIWLKAEWLRVFDLWQIKPD